MEQQPLVSFIIPTYNLPEHMLRECIDSIMSLSLREFEREIIVVDDGSKRAAIASLTDLADTIIYIRQRNSGLSAARNRGLQNASGRYIQFVDGDDTLVSNRYEHCLDIARFQQPDMVMFDFCRKQAKQYSYDDLPAISGSDLMRHNNIRATACGYLFKAKTMGNLRFTPGICHEDEEFTPLLLLRAESVIRTSAPAYYYRQRSESITTSKNLRKMLRRLNDFKAVIYRLNDLCTSAFSIERSSFTSLDRLALQRRVHQLTMDYIYNVIVETRNKKYLDRQLNELRSRSLFPLPDKDYTKKYTWFRRLTTNKIGLAFLFRTLPLIKRER